MSSRCCSFLVGVAAVLAVGCTNSVHEPSVRSEIEVRLPETPDFQARQPAKMFPDGAFSVLALAESSERNIGKEVTVRGRVADTVICSPGAEAAESANEPQKAQVGRAEKRAQERQEEACHPPSHLYLADDVNDEGARLLIVGWPPNKIRGVRSGQELTFRGTFNRVSADGVFIRQAGLLDVAP